MDLLKQLADSKAKVDFTQGLDARFITEEVALALKEIKIAMVHFAFDFMKNEKQIIKGLETFKRVCQTSSRNAIVYMLTNYDTTFEQDIYRVKMIRECKDLQKAYRTEILKGYATMVEQQVFLSKLPTDGFCSEERWKVIHGAVLQRN